MMGVLLITISQAAHWLECGEQKIRKLCRSGDLEARGEGRGRRVTVASVLAFSGFPEEAVHSIVAQRLDQAGDSDPPSSPEMNAQGELGHRITEGRLGAGAGLKRPPGGRGTRGLERRSSRRRSSTSRDDLPGETARIVQASMAQFDSASRRAREQARDE